MLSASDGFKVRTVDWDGYDGQLDIGASDANDRTVDDASLRILQEF